MIERSKLVHYFDPRRVRPLTTATGRYSPKLLVDVPCGDRIPHGNTTGMLQGLEGSAGCPECREAARQAEIQIAH